jgi:hypothetical protein
MKESTRFSALSIAGWGLGVAALLPIILIAGVCLVAPVDWKTKLLGSVILAGLSGALTYASCRCFERRDGAIN